MSTNHRGERRSIHMSNIEWFKNEVELVNEFLKDTAVLLATAEAYDEKLMFLKQKKQALESNITPSLLEQSQLSIISFTIENMEAEIKEKLKSLQVIKENYIAEELVDTIETLTSVEEGEGLSDEACEVIKKINFLMRKYDMSYIA